MARVLLKASLLAALGFVPKLAQATTCYSDIQLPRVIQSNSAEKKTYMHAIAATDTALFVGGGSEA